MIKFEAGKTYYAFSACDHECTWKFTIESRTDKSVWINGKRFGIHTFQESEAIYPLGKYSMCPVLRAEREVA